MKTDDTCAIYCLRLEQLAARAFDCSSREHQRKLRKKLLKTAPKELCHQIENAESFLSVVGDEKLSWVKLKKIAENCDKKKSERDFYSKRQTELSFDGSSDHSQMRDNFHVAFSEEPEVREFSPKSPPISRKYDRHQSTDKIVKANGKDVCQFCNRNGHSFDTCWKRLKLCFRCGGDGHWLGSCSAGQPERRQGAFRPRQWQREAPQQQPETLNE